MTVSIEPAEAGYTLRADHLSEEAVTCSRGRGGYLFQSAATASTNLDNLSWGAVSGTLQ